MRSPTDKPDIIWICVDSLRPDSFRSLGNDRVRGTFFDTFLAGSVVFSRCISVAQSTIPAAFSFFTALYPSVLGVFTQTANCIPEIHPQAVTVTDLLRLAGYSTWRWDDMCTYSCQPKSGFDRFEGGYFGLGDTPAGSFDAPRRRAFLAEFNARPGPRFLYLHLDHLHEYGGESAAVWTGEKYLRHVAEVSREVRDLLALIEGSQRAVVLLNTDHGVTLNEDWAVFERNRGGFFSEGRVRTFAAFRTPGLAPRRVDATVSVVDLAPTLLDLAGVPGLAAQGRSLLPAMTGGELSPVPAVSLWAAQPQARHVIAGDCPRVFDSLCLHTDRWKYVRTGSGEPVVTCVDPADPDAVPSPKIVAELDAFCRERIDQGPTCPDEVYAATGQTPRKRDIPPRISVLLPVRRTSERTRSCLISLVDQIPANEILVLDADPSGRVRRLLEDFADNPRIRRLGVAGLPSGQALDMGLAQAVGEFAALASPLYRYTENYLYELLQALEADPRAVLAYANAYQVLRDTRKDYLYLGPDVFYISHSLREEGCGCVLNLGECSAETLESHNAVGQCALARLDALRRVGGFGPLADPIWEAWKRLAALGRLRHVPRPMIVTDGFVARPSLALEAGPVRSPLVTVFLEADTSGAPLRLALETLRHQGVDDLEVLLVVPEALRGQAAEAAASAAAPDLAVAVVAGNSPEALRRQAIRTSRGRYLCWSRPDERFAPGTLANLAAALEASPKVALAHCRVVPTDARGHPAGPPDERPILYRDLWITRRGLRGVLYRGGLHAEVGSFGPHPGVVAQWDMLLRLAEAGEALFVPDGAVFAPAPGPSASDPAEPAILAQAGGRMNGCLDLMRLYPEVYAQAGAAPATVYLGGAIQSFLNARPGLLKLGLPLVVDGPEKYAPPAWRTKKTS